MRLREDWEFNVLGVYNYRRPGHLRHYMDFIAENHDRLDGDILEAGVYRGRSLLAVALLLKDLGSPKHVYGFDTFTGFPPVYHPNDEVARFDVLRAQRRISQAHLRKVKKNLLLRSLELGENNRPSPASLSLSGDFSNNCLDALRRRLELLELDNVTLVAGPFEETMGAAAGPPGRLMAALLDCDLYESYRVALPFVWSRLSVGGYVALDEYYSLKFPGARIATDEFFLDNPDRPQRHKPERGDFERWYVRRLTSMR
jgi:hypothetical protein